MVTIPRSKHIFLKSQQNERPSTLGEIISSIRQLQGDSSYCFSKKLGMTENELQQLENDELPYQSDLLHQICEKLDISYENLDELIGKKNS